MSALWHGFLKRFSGPYQNLMAKKLRVYGLVSDDLLIETPNMVKALGRLDPATKLARERRIVRAFDLSAKRKQLAPEVAANYDPIQPYLTPLVDEVAAETEQRILYRN